MAHKEAALLNSIDGNSLAFGIIKPVHGSDVHHHHDAIEGDCQHHKGHEETRPDWHREESNTVV